MKDMDRLSIYIAGLFVREALYRSYKPLSTGRGFWRLIIETFMPQPSDDVATYNAKWFIGGMLSGLFMAIWIPLFVMASRSIGLYYTSELLLISYLTMVFLLSIIIVFDLIHQVVSSIKDLNLAEVLERLPIDYDTIEKAASYSILIGGGVSLLLGMGVSVGLITYIVTDNPYAIVFVPLGFLSSIFIIYPISLIVFRKVSSSVSNMVSLIIYTLLVAFTIALYVQVIGLSDPATVYDVLFSYRWAYPLSFVYLSTIGFDPYGFISSMIFLLIGILGSVIIPSRYGIKLHQVFFEKIRSHRIVYRRRITLGFKDVLLLLRDRARSKQFYGQIAALVTPSIIPLMIPRIVSIIRATEYYHVLFIFSLYGLLAYIISVIVSPILVFIESDKTDVLRRNPITFPDVLYGKVFASLILVQPIALFYMILTIYSTLDPLIALVSYYSFNTYWIMGSTINLLIILKILWNNKSAWTELSLGIIKRLLATILSMLPLLIFTPFIFIAYILDVSSAILVSMIAPLPIALYAMFESLRERIV